MNKSELIEKMAEKANISKIDAAKALNSLLEITTETLVSNKKLTVSGFGTFQTVFKQGRVGRNPRTGEKIEIKPRHVAKFKPSAELNNLIY